MKKNYCKPCSVWTEFELESHLMGFSNENPSEPAPPEFEPAPQVRSFRVLLK